MGKLNLANYRPQNDSSTDTDQLRRGKIKDNLILLVSEERHDCRCGCQQKPVGPKAEFRMGHDARLRGKLIRAHCTDTEVTTIDGDKPAVTNTAMYFAEILGWGDYLVVAKDREALRTAERADRANRQVLARATGPRVGDRQCVKVGRWMKTGNVIAVFSDGAEIEVEYVDGRGGIQRKMITPEQAAEYGTGEVAQ